MSVVQQAASGSRPSVSSPGWPSARWVVAGGFAVGVVLGQAGGFFKPGPAQNVLFALSSLGLVAGAPVMAIRQGQLRRFLVAAGFGVLPVAEMMIWSGGPGNAGSFAGAVMFYVPALLLISVPAGLPMACRVLGIVAAIPWLAYSGAYLIAGQAVLAIQIAGYLLFSAAAIGWLVVAVRDREWA